MDTLEQFGISKEEIVERITERAVSGSIRSDDGWDPGLEKHVQRAIDAKVSEMFEAHVLPRVNEMVEAMVLTETNRWGEGKGKTYTFREYLVKAAEDYLNEQVNWDGKPKGRDSLGWSGKQTRIAWMIHQHLHHNIEVAMKGVISNANGKLVSALQDTAKQKLEEIREALSVTVKTR